MQKLMWYEPLRVKIDVLTTVVLPLLQKDRKMSQSLDSVHAMQVHSVSYILICFFNHFLSKKKREEEEKLSVLHIHTLEFCPHFLATLLSNTVWEVFTPSVSTLGVCSKYVYFGYLQRMYLLWVYTVSEPALGVCSESVYFEYLQWVCLLWVSTVNVSTLHSYTPPNSKLLSCHWAAITLVKITEPMCQIYWHLSQGYPSFSSVASLWFTLLIFPNFSSPPLVSSHRVRRIHPVWAQGSLSFLPLSIPIILCFFFFFFSWSITVNWYITYNC